MAEDIADAMPVQQNGEEDSSDARGLFGRLGGHRSPKSDEEAVLETEWDADDYPMNHTNRGIAVIFNHMFFEAKLKMNPRRGTELDRDRLFAVFTRLGFRVECHDDFTRANIETTLRRIQKEDHRESDCFVCIMLTHGEEGFLYSRDAKYRTQDLWTPFLGDACPTLAGKPKLFFIQACQGDHVDSGVELHSRTMLDAPTAVYKIPTFADILIAYSTVPGFYSWRNTSAGSWFMQTLCDVLDTCGENEDLLSALVRVNRRIAYTCISYVPGDYSMHNKKQCPAITCMLTRKLFLRPKPKVGV